MTVEVSPLPPTTSTDMTDIPFNVRPSPQGSLNDQHIVNSDRLPTEDLEKQATTSLIISSKRFDS